MKLELTNMPYGCQAALTENMQTISVEPAIRRVIGKAVCGARSIEATSEYVMSELRFSSSPSGKDSREDAKATVHDDISTMVTAMCIDCPNRVTGFSI